MRMRVHLKIAAALGLTALLFAGCGGDSGDAAITVLKAAATKTTAAGSARMAMTMTMGSGSSAVTVTGEGEFDMASKRGRMTMDMGSIPGAAGSTMDMVYDGTIMYMKFPPGLVPSSKPWIKLDLQKAGEELGIDLGALSSSASQNDPTQFLNYLNGVSSDVKKVGTEDVRGTSTTHYKATIDMRKAAETLGPDAAPSVQKLIDQMGQATMPAEYWVDGDGLARRVKMKMDPDGKGPGPSATMTYELYDFGAPVNVSPPPAREVVDFSDVLKSTRPGG